MSRHRRIRMLPILACLAAPLGVLAQEELPPRQILEQDADPATADVTPPDTHADREAPGELMGRIAREPGHVIGMPLVLEEGAEHKTVGPVLAVRKRLADQQLYLIVDATEFFNSATQYAVAVMDLDRMEDGTLVTPAAPGMHLLGMQYYAEDYADLEEPAVVPAE